VAAKETRISWPSRLAAAAAGDNYLMTRTLQIYPVRFLMEEARKNFLSHLLYETADSQMEGRDDKSTSGSSLADVAKSTCCVILSGSSFFTLVLVLSDVCGSFFPLFFSS
jgi:hypothetical protein